MNSKTPNTIAYSLCGQKHDENEDSILVRQLSESAVLLVVADGISSSSYGGSVSRWLTRKLNDFTPETDQYFEELKNFILKLQKKFLAEFIGFINMLESGSTLSVALITDYNLHCFWLGDTPIFLTNLNDYETTQVSVDQAKEHVLQDWFSGFSPFKVQIKSIPLCKNCIVTVASDGLLLSENELKCFYKDCGFDQQALQKCVEEKVSCKGSDDSSIVAFNYFA